MVAVVEVVEISLNITSDLPLMKSNSLYRKIDYSNEDQGFLGFAYGCTNATNYASEYETYNNGKWVRNMNY